MTAKTFTKRLHALLAGMRKSGPGDGIGRGIQRIEKQLPSRRSELGEVLVRFRDGSAITCWVRYSRPGVKLV